MSLTIVVPEWILYIFVFVAVIYSLEVFAGVYLTYLKRKISKLKGIK
jgi:hypothetical protein